MTALDRIRALYDELPTIDCKGWCWHSCGPIDMSDVERERITELGVEIPVFTHERAQRWASNERLYCPALTFSAQDGTAIGCKVYEDRPLVCRTWGAGEEGSDMACPYGCAVSRRLSGSQIMHLLVRVMRIGGHSELGLGRH